MLAVNRFRVAPHDEDEFFRAARAAVDFMASREGAESVDLVQNLDEPDLWAIVGRWANVGSYRRAFNGYEAKVVLVPLLSRAIDEPGAYDVPDHVGLNLPRSRWPDPPLVIPADAGISRPDSPQPRSRGKPGMTGWARVCPRDRAGTASYSR